MGQSITVVPVETSRDLSRFLDFQYHLYRDSKYFVPPLRMDLKKTLSREKNAFFEHGDIAPFIALDASGTVVGRIAAIRNGMHLKTHADGTGFFGFYECVEDQDVSAALFEAVEKWHTNRGHTSIRGPVNPSMNDISGLLVGGFDRYPSIMMPYNFPYYEDFLLAGGFERAMTMWAYYGHPKYVTTDRLERGANMVRRRNPGITLRTMDVSRYDEEALTVLDIFNDAWSDNWGYVPMTEAEFQQLADEMKQVVDPDLVLILEDEGVPIAFSITLPNLNEALINVKNGRLFPDGMAKLLWQAKVVGIRECRTLLMGIRKDYRGKGLDAVLNLETMQNGVNLGYTACELSWVLDSNPRMINALQQLNAVVDKEYAMFEKRIDTPGE